MMKLASALTSLPLLLALFTSVEGQTCNAPPTVTELNFFGSQLTENTLHLPGGKLRYSNIGTKEDAPLDLTVTIFGGNYHNITNIWDERNAYWGTNKGPHMNGYMGDRQFGNINLQYRHGSPHSGEGQFEFCLVASGTNTPVEIESFGFTVWDLDERGQDKDDPDNGTGIKEKLSFDTAQAYNYSLFPDWHTTEIKPICEDGSTIECTDPECSGVHPGHISCDTGVRTVFRSSESGGLKDNPTTPHRVDDEQRKRAVYFHFEDTSCFRFTFNVYCPEEPPHDTMPGIDDINYRNLAEISELSGCRENGQHPWSGGNFLFAGTSDALFHEVGCPTQEPTPAPSDIPSLQPSIALDPRVLTPEPTPYPTPFPTPYPTPFPTIKTGQCHIEGGINEEGSTGENIGELKFCVRNSFGYRDTSNAFKEVNFIETKFIVQYNLDAGFCVNTINVAPKAKQTDLRNEDAYNLQAWLCDTGQLEYDSEAGRTLPKKVTKYNTVGGTDSFNQGSLITVCVSPDDLAYSEGIRMASLEDFTWVRDEFDGLDFEVEQAAIESGGPASNFLTYFDSDACEGSEWCYFSTILFADFYLKPGTVVGDGNAKLQFDTSRRRLADGRQLQEDPSSTFDLSLGVNGVDDGGYKLKTAGATSPRLYGLIYISTVIFCATAMLV